MMQLLAHVTPSEAPVGLLLFLGGCACGATIITLIRRLRTRFS